MYQAYHRWCLMAGATAGSRYERLVGVFFALRSTFSRHQYPFSLYLRPERFVIASRMIREVRLMAADQRL